MPRPPRAARYPSAVLLLGFIAGATLPTLASAMGGGTIAKPAATPAPPSKAKERANAEKAVDLYNDGVRIVGKADDASARAADATDPKQRATATAKAHEQFAKALEKFQKAVDLSPNMYQGWNYLGYCERNLGNYADALAAYNQALTLNPTYSEAIEYRGRAYLGLGRTVDAQTAYLTLFAADRALADKLLAAMKEWLSAQRSTASAIEPAKLDEFGRWIDERSRIAAQTAGLSPAGAGARWR